MAKIDGAPKLMQLKALTMLNSVEIGTLLNLQQERERRLLARRQDLGAGIIIPVVQLYRERTGQGIHAASLVVKAAMGEDPSTHPCRACDGSGTVQDRDVNAELVALGLKREGVD